MISKFFKIIFLLAIISGSIFVSRVPIQNILAQVRSAYFPCQTPILYSLGTFDTRFGISEGDFKKDIIIAKEIWEKPIGRELFKSETNGDLKINLIYDFRQDTTQTLKKLGLSIDDTQASYNAIKIKYNSLKIDYTNKKNLFNKTLAQFQKDKKTVEEEVAYWNSHGGAKGEDYDRITTESTELNDRSAQIKISQDVLNEQVDTINALVITLNRVASSLNMSVSQFNEIGKETGQEFDEALYVQDQKGNHIDVFQFNNNSKLIRVLAHEFGHALGLEHIDNPKAIMYRLNKDTNESLTPDDLSALKNKCGIKE